MWLLWILFLDAFGHHAVVSAATCIVETNDTCDWKDVTDVNDITSEAIVAQATTGMNKLEFKRHPEDGKAIDMYLQHAAKYPDPPFALDALDKRKGFDVRLPGMIFGDPATLNCSKKQEEFPNACSMLMEMVVFRDRKPGGFGYLQKETVNLGIAFYFYSTYSETEKKVHEAVEVAFALGTSYGLCHKRFKLSGQCFNGMSDKKDQLPRALEDPPMPPSLGEKCQPTFPELKAQRPPWGLVPILLILLLIMFLLGGAVAVYVYLERQRRTQEETALRSTSAVELS